MWILPLLGYTGVILGFSFLTLAIASGLYYLSELVEEHTVISQKLLIRLIQFIIAVHILLVIFDGFPIMLTLFSASSHGVYLMNITRTFPMVKLTDGVFILSCCLVIGNHFLWFNHFSNPILPSDHPFNRHPNGPSRTLYDYSSSADPSFASVFPTFTEISAFFGICVWLVPFSLFVSLSAGENVLPSTSATMDSSSASKKKGSGAGMAKMVFGGAKEWLGSIGEALGIANPGGRGHARFE
ncbi:DUF396-domain-containing protein [Tuber magnatum]|uniref:DUF396-domain-containing protein n=1 Tax=Tuber magnatum TaxID=42249 RepID=A0A317SVA5_9PEZI|nr:DUF396-domain-containing protein [Tuber magnatum]